MVGWGGWVGGWVGSNALLSSSPSLIWLQLGFGLARAVTISQKEIVSQILLTESFIFFPAMVMFGGVWFYKRHAL